MLSVKGGKMSDDFPEREFGIEAKSSEVLDGELCRHKKKTY